MSSQNEIPSEIPSDIEEVLQELTQQEIHTLYPKLPESIIIPSLQKFKDAPWNFTKLLVHTSDGDELIFYDGEAIVVSSTMTMYFRTRTTLKLYKLQLRSEDMPKALSYYDITEISRPHWSSLESFIKFNLIPCISSQLKGFFKQGHLSIYKFWCGTKLVPPSERRENIYNHRLINAIHTPLSKNVWLIIPTANPIIVESSDHPRLEIQVDFTTNETFFLAYHPEPAGGLD